MPIFTWQMPTPWWSHLRSNTDVTAVPCEELRQVGKSLAQLNVAPRLRRSSACAANGGSHHLLHQRVVLTTARTDGVDFFLHAFAAA